MRKIKKSLIVLLAICQLVGFVYLVPSGAEAATQKLNVVIEFDDGTASQAVGADILEKYGFRGTFYVNSGRIGKSGYLGSNYLHNLQGKGHEIGSHSRSHLDLATLPLNDIETEIREDKKALSSLGLLTDNFAYPFGSYNDSVKQSLKKYGYLSGRTVGGIGYGGFRNAESLPPRDTYALETAPSLKANTTYAEVSRYIEQGQSTGGLLQLVVHRVDYGGSVNSITPEFLDSICRLLKEKESVNVIDVMTLRKSLQVKDPVVTPPATTTKVVPNSGFEEDIDKNNLPDYWDLIGWGDTSYRYARVAGGHTGSYSERLDIYQNNGGDRKVVTSQKDLTRALSAVGGSRYQIGGYYKGTIPIQFVIYYRDASNRWVWLAESPAYMAHSGWAKATWDTPALPADAKKISIGFQAKRVGTAFFDDMILLEIR